MEELGSHWTDFGKKWYLSDAGIKVRMRRFRVTIVAVENNKYYILWTCVCSLSYAARKAHAPYDIAICGLSDRNIFFHIIS